MLHIIIICFNNPEQTRTRWQRDVLPALSQVKMPYVVTCVDNSTERSPMLAELFGEESYLWQKGQNTFYGGALNIAVPRVPSDIILYVCSKHGFMIDPGWINDLIGPLVNDPQTGAAGFLMGSNSPGGVAHACNAPWIKDMFYFTHEDGTGHVPQHLQGGVFAARTELMLRFPYPPEVQHCYTDHVLTWAILKAGFKCVNVPTICSLYCEGVRDRRGFKFIHDTSEDSTRVE